MPFSVRILPGTTLAFDDLPPRSIALDGVVLGCRIDPLAYRFSFDHHDGLRFPLLATCEQVCLAIELGLDPELIESVLINDLDRDVAAALWLLRHPARAEEVRDRITGLGRIDSHGPGAPGGAPTPEMQTWLPAHGVILDQAAVERAICGCTAWIDGRLPAANLPHQDGEAILLPGCERVPAQQGAAGLYRQGHRAFVLMRELSPGVWHYTACKRSDFHPYDLSRLRSLLAERESGWGGTSTLLGSPRPSGSRLPPEQMIDLLRSASHDPPECESSVAML